MLGLEGGAGTRVVPRWCTRGAQNTAGGVLAQVPCTHMDPTARASYSSQPELHPGPKRRKRPTVCSLNLLPTKG